MAASDVLRWFRVAAFCAMLLAAIWAMHFNLFVSWSGAVDDPFVYTNGYLAAHVFARNLLPLLVSLILLSPFAAIRSRTLYAVSIAVWFIVFVVGDGGLYVADMYREVSGRDGAAPVWPRIWVILHEFGYYFFDVLVAIIAFHAFAGGMRGKRTPAGKMGDGAGI